VIGVRLRDAAGFIRPTAARFRRLRLRIGLPGHSHPTSPGLNLPGIDDR
jgi:hypothetical protein